MELFVLYRNKIEIELRHFQWTDSADSGQHNLQLTPPRQTAWHLRKKNVAKTEKFLYPSLKPFSLISILIQITGTKSSHINSDHELT